VTPAARSTLGRRTFLTAAAWSPESPRAGKRLRGALATPDTDHTAKGVRRQVPAGAWLNRSLTLCTGQCHVQRYMQPLLERIERGELDPTRIITHRLPRAEGPHGYDIFKNKKSGCEKVVLTT
jgi:threonine dehydrogenase-like Zn-dependent dehydrogenase